MNHRVLESGRFTRHAENADRQIDAGSIALRDAAAAYKRLREALVDERAISAELALRLDEAGSHAEMEEKRVKSLLDSVRSLHRALYSGTTSEHILRAAMDVTEAGRGYYLSETIDGLRVRAAVDVPASAGDEPSPFIASLARRVLARGEAIHWTEDAPPAGLMPGDLEQFREGIAVPVSTLGATSGVIIALDKDGEFLEPEVRSLLSVGTEAGVAVENARLHDEMQQAYVGTIAVLADAVQAKDPYTHSHCEQVSAYARRAALRLGLSDTDLRVTCYAALLHDVGKIGVSDGVLNKPGPLIAEERKLVEAHVRIGHDLLNVVPALREIASAVLYHHERYDGCGYPEGLAGESIPMASRIVAVVDAYCAMLDVRSYKEAYSPEHARAELIRCAGTQFDPQVVQAVLAAIDEVDGTVQADGMWKSGCGILPPLREYSVHENSG